MSKAHEWLDCLQRNGYRITDPRRVVVEIMAESTQALTPSRVYEIGHQRYPKLGLVTVYRTLEKLEELNLIQRVHQPQGCQAFITAFQGHQHMLICSGCGRIEFFEGDEEGIETLIEKISQRSGFQVSEHWLQLFGLCRECQTQRSAPPKVA